MPAMYGASRWLEAKADGTATRTAARPRPSEPTALRKREWAKGQVFIDVSGQVWVELILVRRLGIRDADQTWWKRRCCERFPGRTIGSDQLAHRSLPYIKLSQLKF
jgi:hypothetical protein